MKWLAALAVALFASHAAGATASPFVRIVDFASTPVSSCSVPNAEFFVVAQGDATTSDSFSISANGSVIYQWEGETMAWVSAGNLTSYSITGEPADLPQNTVLTATITTFDRANPTGPLFTAGNPVYRAQASWNCTTGAQVGAIINLDTRPRVVPAMRSGWLAGFTGLVSMLVWARLRRLKRRAA